MTAPRETKPCKKPPRPSWNEYYLGMAATISWRASCLGRPVGALIVKENRILTTGYNGTPDGWPNCDEEERGCPRCAMREDEEKDRQTNASSKQPKSLDVCVCVHAEANALNTAARFGIAVEGAVIYTTDAPCMQCAKSLLQCGIRGVHYLRKFTVDDPSTERGRASLAAQHQLMRKLEPEKYIQSNVGEALGRFAKWLASDPKHGLQVPLQRSALDDDQYDFARPSDPADES